MAPILRRACLGCRFPLEAGHDATGVARCPECGREFDPLDTSTYGVRLEKPKLLATVPTAVEGEAMRASLAAIGIMSACEVVRALSWGVEMREVGCRVHVDASDLDAARRALEAARREAEEPSELAAPGPDWSCAACGEQVDGIFDLCWNCGAERPRPEPTP